MSEAFVLLVNGEKIKESRGVCVKERVRLKRDPTVACERVRARMQM